MRDGSAWFAIGASGGRKIIPAVTADLSFLIDHGMDLEDAFHQPRIDASGDGEVRVDPRLGAATLDRIAQQFPDALRRATVLPTNYACPSAVMGDAATGERVGVTDVMSPWSGAAA